MPKPLKRVIFLGLGWAFILLGIAGLFLPVLQGILFLLIGVAILSRESDWVQGWIDRLKARYPKFARQYDEAEATAARWWRRLTRGEK